MFAMRKVKLDVRLPIIRLYSFINKIILPPPDEEYFSSFYFFILNAIVLLTLSTFKKI